MKSPITESVCSLEKDRYYMWEFIKAMDMDKEFQLWRSAMCEVEEGK